MVKGKPVLLVNGRDWKEHFSMTFQYTHILMHLDDFDIQGCLNEACSTYISLHTEDRCISSRYWFQRLYRILRSFLTSAVAPNFQTWRYPLWKGHNHRLLNRQCQLCGPSKVHLPWPTWRCVFFSAWSGMLPQSICMSMDHCRCKRSSRIRRSLQITAV